MYSLQLLEIPKKCSLACGRTVPARLAGHYCRDPLCDACFAEAAPALVAALGLRSVSIRLLESRLGVRCAHCGDRLSGRRMVGHHHGEPHCNRCFDARAPEMASLLLLEEAALEAADSRCGAQDLLQVAIYYARRLFRLDARHPRLPLSRRTAWPWKKR